MVRQRSAKPLFIGSIPIAASNNNQEFTGRNLAARFCLCHWCITAARVALAVEQLFEPIRGSLLHGRQDVGIGIQRKHYR